MSSRADPTSASEPTEVPGWACGRNNPKRRFSGPPLSNYCFWGVALESEVKLDAAPSTHNERTTLKLSIAQSCSVVPNGRRLLLWPDDDPVLEVSDFDGGLLFRYFDRADFCFKSASLEVHATPELDLPVTTFSQLLLGQVIPMALSELGRLVVHAAGAILPAGLVGFLGPSGTGKSTLLTALTVAGHRAFADDYIVMDSCSGGYVASPGPRSIRLHTDSISQVSGRHASSASDSTSGKKQIQPPGQDWANATAAPRRFFALDPQDDPSCPILVERLETSAAHLALMRNTLRLRREQRSTQVSEFEQLTSLLAQAPVYRLTYPKRFDRLPEVVDCVSNL